MTASEYGPGSYTQDAVDASMERPERQHAAYERLLERTREVPAVPTAVVWPCAAHALEAPIDAAQENIIEPLLFGPAAEIRSIAAKAEIDLGSAEIVDIGSEHEAAAAAVAAAREGRAHAIMKGSLHTDELMSPIVARDGLRTGRRISHVFAVDVPGHPEVLFLTDAAINIFPDLETKRDIVQNAIDLHIGLGLGEPRVAILSAVEVINTKIPGTVDAAALCKMADRGQIRGGILDGPLAMDNAVNEEAARIKGIKSEVAGRAQVLVAPDLEAGNIMAKDMMFLANADAAGLVLGASVPIILTSRADSVRTRMASAAMGARYAHYLVQQQESLAV